MQVRCTFRLYPARGQRSALARAFGCARVVYNDALRAREDARAQGKPAPGTGELSKQLITEAKHTPQRAWLSEVSAVVLQRSLAAGRYFAPFVVETTADEALPETVPEVGIDLGPSHCAVLSDGTEVTNPGSLRRAGRKPKKAQRSLSREEKGSANRSKARVKVARAHVQAADARREFHHQLSTKTIRENQAVYVENLAAHGLARTRLAKGVHDAGWSAFVNMLAYKAARYGRAFGRIGRWFPSSKMCSHRGAITASMPLKVRTWTRGCGAEHDRDHNAADNVLAAGRAERINACGGTVSPSA